ncbi:MAG: N-acetylmuramoyl-L-alanine amidase [Deltaproteobacteria bacterium]|nr:MAG: N-acetylmuramoyl-L-alanine amidase [Deltaproteobacteria bacterium]
MRSFLSIHANAAQSPEAEGIELYYLNRASDRSSEKLARRENGPMKVKNEKEIHAILSDLIQAAATEESALLAKDVKSQLCALQKKFQIEDIKVKTALFYVLVGAKCPSLLIEVGFVTHSKESKRLKSEKFQKQFADSIAEGVKNYWQQFEKEGGDL